MSDSNGDGSLREVSGVARRNLLSLDEAKSLVAAGGAGAFGDVFPRLDAADHDALREWFCRTRGVLPNEHPLSPPVKNHTIRPAAPLPPDLKAAYPCGEFCKCGGLLVQDGKCRRCTSCLYTEGTCS